MHLRRLVSANIFEFQLIQISIIFIHSISSDLKLELIKCEIKIRTTPDVMQNIYHETFYEREEL